MTFFISFANFSKRLNYVNHARRLADGDWTGPDDDEGEDMEKQEEGERRAEDEGMEVERRKLPKHYANQVRNTKLRPCRVLSDQQGAPGSTVLLPFLFQQC